MRELHEILIDYKFKGQELFAGEKRFISPENRKQLEDEGVINKRRKGRKVEVTPEDTHAGVRNG